MKKLLLLLVIPLLASCSSPVSLPRSMVDPNYIPPPTRADTIKYGASSSIIPAPVLPDQNTMVSFSSDKTAMMALLQATIQNRDKMKAKAAEKPKLKLEFKMIDLGNGVKMPVLTGIESYDQPTFDGTPINQVLPENEAYKTARSLFHDAAMFGVVGYGINKFSSMIGKIATGGAATYNGDYVSIKSQSDNVTSGSAAFDGSGSAYHIGEETTSTDFVETATQ